VDKWSKDEDGKWAYRGMEYYTYEAIGPGFPGFLPPTINWLGLGTSSWTDDAADIYTTGFPTAFLTGQVRNVTGERVPGKGGAFRDLVTTHEQDKEFLDYIERTFVGTKGAYDIPVHNCRRFLQRLFDIAKEKYPDAKEDTSGGKKACD